MHVYILTYSRLKMENFFISPWVPTEGTLISASAVPHCRYAMGNMSLVAMKLPYMAHLL